jgi:hypothetical protein
MRTALVEDPETNVLDNAKQEVYIDLTDCDERPTKISNSAYMEPKVRVHTYHAMEFDHNKTGTLSLATKVSDERQTTFGMLSNPKIIDRCEEMSRENQQGAKSVLSQEIKDGGNAQTDHSNPCSEVMKELSITSEEYKALKEQIESSCGLKVHKIEKINDPRRRRKYEAHRCFLIESKVSFDTWADNDLLLRCHTRPQVDPNEHQLFHGASSDSITKILRQGFNRSYAGAHGCSFGMGVNFAAQASYSANYALPDQEGVQRMFLCDVLVGEAAAGMAGLRAPPPRAAGADPHDLCDSTVDNMARPSIFVCYHDDQVNPGSWFLATGTWLLAPSSTFPAFPHEGGQNTSAGPVACQMLCLCMLYVLYGSSPSLSDRLLRPQAVPSHLITFGDGPESAERARFHAATVTTSAMSSTFNAGAAARMASSVAGMRNIMAAHGSARPPPQFFRNASPRKQLASKVARFKPPPAWYRNLAASTAAAAAPASALGAAAAPSKPKQPTSSKSEGASDDSDARLMGLKRRRHGV